MQENLGGIGHHVRACADRCKGMAAIGESAGADLIKGSSGERFRHVAGAAIGKYEGPHVCLGRRNGAGR